MNKKTKELSNELKKSLAEAEQRVMKKIRLRMAIIAKDVRLRKKVEKEIRENLNKLSKN